MNTNRRKTRLTISGLFIFGVLANLAAMPEHKTDEEPLYLSIALNDPYNADVQVRFAVKIGKPFQTMLDNGEVKTTISGIIRKPTGNEYPAAIAVSEWASSTSNITDTSDLRLKLDQASGYGPVSSFVYLRTVTLSQRSRP